MIPMAGQSLRFKNIGFNSPKWTIQIGNQTMFELALESILPVQQINEKIILIVLKKDESDLHQIVSRIQVNNLQVITINNSTSGQAETVLLGLKKLKFSENERLVVWCSDSFISNLSIKHRLISSNHVVLSKLLGDQWSFAKIIRGKVVETAEKKRISPLASIGLYFFQSINDYMSLNIMNGLELSESYIAPLYNQLIVRKNPVNFTEISNNSFFSFGTPEELFRNCKILNLKLDSRLL